MEYDRDIQKEKEAILNRAPCVHFGGSSIKLQ